MDFTHTTACEDRDFPEWHGGRTHALVWALLLEYPELEQFIADARSRLDGLLLPRYERQPHVTVAFAGLAEQPGLPGYDGEDLEADLDRLRSVVCGPVDVRATGWGSFPMVPYLAVKSEWLHRAHAALDRNDAERDQMSYVPHVTVGHWAGAWRRDSVLERLAAPLPTQDWQVSELSLMRYETHDIAGPLEPVGHMGLADGRWSLPHEAPDKVPRRISRS